MSWRRTLARGLMRYARHLLPREQREWGAGMEAELGAVPDEAALGWALGAWRAAWWARVRMVCGGAAAHIALAFVVAFEFEGELLKAAAGMGGGQHAAALSIGAWIISGFLFIAAGAQMTRKRASSPWLFLAGAVLQRLSHSVPLPMQHPVALVLDSWALLVAVFVVLLVRSLLGRQAHNVNWRWRVH